MSLFTSARVEIEFSAGTWTDVTIYHTTEYSDMVISCGRPTEFDPVAAGSVTLNLRNMDGRFTPDNASSPYSPNVIEGKRIRVSLTKAGVTYCLITAYIQAWELSFPTDDINDVITTVTALDSLAPLTQRTLGGQLQESALSVANANGTWCDFFTCVGRGGANTQLEVVTNSPATSHSTGSVWGSAAGDLVGPISWGTDQKLATDGFIQTAALEYFSAAPGNYYGNMLVITPRSSLQAFEFLYNLGSAMAAKNLSIPVFAVFYSGSISSGNFMWCLGANDSGSPMVTNYLTLISGQNFTIGNQNQGQWEKISFVSNGGNTDIYLNDSLVMTTSGRDIANARTIALGFDVDRGGPYNGIYLQGGGGAFSGIAAYGARVRTTAQQSFAAGTGLTIGTSLTELLSQVADFTPGITVAGSDDSRAAVTGSTSKMSALASLRQVMDGNGGAVWARADGTVLLMHPDVLYPLTPAFTVSSEGDLVGPPVLKRSVDTRPTRVTVTSAAVSTTAIDTAAEASGLRRDMTLTTTSATTADALTVGWARMIQENALRIAQMTIDLIAASTDLTATLLSPTGTTGVLFPSQRGRINVPSAVFGAPTKDFFAQGWTISIGADSALLQMNCSSATVATVTGGTCVGTTSTGTVIITSDRPWTTDALAYPLDLDWAGERITVSAPSGATSPQTFTVSARGVSGGTAASAHSAGTSVDTWLGSN